MAILAATVFYLSWHLPYGMNPLSLLDTVMLLVFVGTLVSGQRLRRASRWRLVERWTHVLFFGFALASLLASLVWWFKGPMHDIGAAFGSHGRWGCTLYGDDGPVYTLRDDTVPLILFAPALVATAAHWLATDGARRLLAFSTSKPSASLSDSASNR